MSDTPKKISRTLYESPITYHSKDMANVKVFAERHSNRQTGQKLYASHLSIRA
jgi:hypothetical protein